MDATTPTNSNPHPYAATPTADATRETFNIARQYSIPDEPLTPLQEAATYAHEYFTELCNAGFTRPEALSLLKHTMSMTQPPGGAASTPGSS